MVGVKKFVVRRVEAAEKVRQLVRKYRNLKISLKGSATHKRMNLLPDQALVSAWGKEDSAEW
jgi:hypothetical protein